MPRFDNKLVILLIALLVSFSIGCGSRAKSSSSTNYPLLNTNADPLPNGAVVRLGSTSFLLLNEVWCIAYSPSGSTIATGTMPGSVFNIVELWSANTGRKTGELRVNGHNILGLAWSASGSEIAVSIDKSIEIWDVKTEKLLGKLECKPISGDPRIFWGLRWSRDGRRLTAYLPRDVDPAEVHVWDAQTRKISSKWSVHSEILGLDISADGELIATAGRYFLEVRELATSREVFSSYGFRFRIYSIAFSPDGSTLAGGVEVSNDETGVLLFDAKTGDATDIQPRFPGRYTEVAFSPDGKTLAAAGWKGSVRLWDVASKSMRAELKYPGCVGRFFSFSPDGRSLATAERRCLVWDVDTAQPRQVPEMHFRWANSAAFTGDGLLIASGSGDETVRSWQLGDGAHQQATQLGARALALSPMGDKIACLSANGILSLRDPRSGERIGNLSRPLRGMHAEVGRGVFSSDGKLLATTHGDDSICLWAVDELKLFQTVPCETENRHDVYDIPRISISNNGKFLAWSKQATDVQLWDIERGQADASIPDSATSTGTPLAFAPDSESIFVSKPTTPSKPPSKEGFFESQRVIVRRWDFLKEKELWRSSESERMLCLRASPDGTVLALAGYSDHYAIKLLDAKTGSAVGEFPGHLDRIHEFYFSPDSLKLVSASYDNTLLVWDMKSRKRP